MSLITRINQPFASITKDSAVQGDNIVFIKGGSTIIDDAWLQFNDLRIDVKKLVDGFISQQARRVFNVKNGILNVLITLNKSNKLEVIPSLSLNQTIQGNVKVFESLTGRLPLILVTLQQDGSDNLSSIKNITDNDIEICKGYGNFTIIGKEGETGPQGDTGPQGGYGIPGLTGLVGEPGLKGFTGVLGETGALGQTGLEGVVGASIPSASISVIADPIADFVGYPLSGDVGVQVYFTNLTAGEWNSVLWSFGDGNFSTLENPVNVYALEGTYTVVLYVYGVTGTSVKTRYDYITVLGEPYYIQDVVDADNPSGIWQKEIDELNEIQDSVVGGDTDAIVMVVPDKDTFAGEFDVTKDTEADEIDETVRVPD